MKTERLIYKTIGLKKAAAAVSAALFVFACIMPVKSASALTMAEIMPPGMVLGANLAISQNTIQTGEAQAYIVVDDYSGQILLSKNPNMPWPPASLTKLVTALVLLDSNTSFDKTIAMEAQDEVGGARLATKAGVKYTVKDLLHASLIASDNNATHALSRAAGFSSEQFVALMNLKAKSLGALNSHFVEPTGIDPNNYTTAGDFAKIVTAAFSADYLTQIAKKPAYTFASVNNSRYKHNIKTTNKLLNDGDLSVIGGKTGYLEESLYNFATVAKDHLGNKYTIVVLGAPNPSEQFGQTKELAMKAMAIKVFGQSPQVLGTSTSISISIINQQN